MLNQTNLIDITTCDDLQYVRLYRHTSLEIDWGGLYLRHETVALSKPWWVLHLLEIVLPHNYKLLFSLIRALLQAYDLIRLLDDNVDVQFGCLFLMGSADSLFHCICVAGISRTLLICCCKSSDAPLLTAMKAANECQLGQKLMIVVSVMWQGNMMMIIIQTD